MNKDQIVLVTGNQGFIGTWLTLRLLRSGFKVAGVDNRSSPGNRLFDQLSLESKLEKQYSANICDLDSMTSILSDVKPGLIINLAGQAIIPRAFKEPFETFKTNTLGTLSVLEAARQTNYSKAVICITSDKVYQNSEQIWPFREIDNLGGKDIYSASKAAAELVCFAYSQSHLANSGINIQSVRLGNVVGGGDWSKNRLIPDFMYTILEKSNFYIRYPNATRPFQHVLDVVDGILKISSAALNGQIKTGEAWNLGPKNNTVGKVKEVVELCKKVWPDIQILQNTENVAEDQNLAVEIAKYKSVFGAPKHTSLEALEMTINWYKDFFKSISVDKLIENDFNIYDDKHD